MSCVSRGRHKLASLLGKHKANGNGKIKYHTLDIPCAFNCEKGPTVIINGDLHSMVDEEKLQELLRDYEELLEME
jgi:NADH:ubiquinone oxidoreductase subunit E